LHGGGEVRARQKEWKGMREGSKNCSYSAREGEGTLAGKAVAINVHEAGRLLIAIKERP
jgi:hypothetical protein